ncbi:hypothetical protein HDU84_003601 [Entophlyctis sp. JEL0112]|nr:hypothetical protein HDU84_003601 [Entophlyctis sp. JEL0112]
MGVGVAMYPHASSYEMLVALRMVFALGGGAASAMLTAVLGDYVDGEVWPDEVSSFYSTATALDAEAEDASNSTQMSQSQPLLAGGHRIGGNLKSSRGKLAGLVGLSSGLGALVALFIFLPMPVGYTDIVEGLHRTYLAVGLMSAAFGCILAAFLPGAAPVQTTPQTSAKSILKVAAEGFSSARIPEVLLGYVASFLARGDTVIITLFVPLWVYKTYIDNGSCTAPSPDAPDIRDVCASAYKWASAVSGVAQTLALIGAPVFGALSDWTHAKIAVLASAILGCASYAVMFAMDPTEKFVLAVAAVAGLSEIGLVIGSMVLVTDSAYINPTVRGSVAGVSSCFGAMGILISSKLGGYLFDVWHKGAPFFILAIGHGIAICVGVAVITSTRRTAVGRFRLD